MSRVIERSMFKTIVVVGFGPGISTAVARKFGAEGFAVALVARNEGLPPEEGRLAERVAALKAKGIAAASRRTQETLTPLRQPLEKL